MTPWDFWLRSVDTGLKGARTGLRFAEMVGASNEVVASRCASIAHASRDPLNGDYRELARMVPEKVDAFGSAAASTMSDMAAIQRDAVANFQQLATIAMGGRLPTLKDVTMLSERSLRMAERAIGAGDAALRPVHRAATGNARRLRRKA